MKEFEKNARTRCFMYQSFFRPNYIFNNDAYFFSRTKIPFDLLKCKSLLTSFWGSDIVSKYNVGLKTLLLQGLSEPEFYGDLVYKFRKIIGKNDFPYHFKKIVVRYKKIGYNINVMRQTERLVVNPIKVNSFAYLFNCTTVGRTSD